MTLVGNELPPLSSAPLTTPDLSIIILTWREDEPLSECLDSIPAAAGSLDVEIIVIANGARACVPTSAPNLHAFSVIHNESNVGVASGRNQGFRTARGRYLLSLDVDTRLTERALEILVNFMDAQPDVGLAAPRLVDSQGHLQFTCRKFPSPWGKFLRRMPVRLAQKFLADEMLADWDHNNVRDVDYVIGACQIIRRDAFEQVGELETEIFYGPEDIDYCLRMWRRGWRVTYVPHATVVHSEQRLTRRDFFSSLTLSHARGAIFFFQKYRHLWRLPRLPLRAQLRWVLVLGDILLVNLVGWLALWLGMQRSRWWLATNWGESAGAWFLFLTLVWFVVAEVNDLYDLRVAGIVYRALTATLRVVVSTLLIYLVLYFIAAPQSLPRHIIIFFALGSTALVSLWRWFFAMALRILPIQRRVLVVGEDCQWLLQALRENAPAYYQPICLVNAPRENESFAQVVGSVTRLPAVVARERIDQVFVDLKSNADDELLTALATCREQGILVNSFAEVYEQLTGRVPVMHLDQAWLATLSWAQDAHAGFSNLLKRIWDVSLAVIGLLVMLPVCLLSACAIRLDSAGPIFYQQPRVGKNGRIFNLYKFRTMFVNAEGDGLPRWATEDDPRVTRVGRLLRRWGVDEIPQLLNVLRGEMSWVGPRPERPELAQSLQREIPFYRMRHAVRPGLTGWAAIHFGYGRSVEDARIKLEYDLLYIKQQSLYLDWLIMLKTVGAILLPPRTL